MEYWDIYDSEKRVTGRKMLRNDWHMKPGDYHLTVLALIRDAAGRILITQRKADKEWAPLKWERREVAEETGLRFAPEQGRCIHTYRSDSPSEQNNYFVDIYEFRGDFTQENVKIQEDEVESFRLATPQEVRALGEADDFLHYKRLAHVLPEGEVW